ncbi:MAG: methyltransferase domain-containing protein [Emcibacter sp.]|nr:methyltransferase domain-containing protein [Emcibacter sp.]
MPQKETEQVKFWRGEFGDTYVDRNTTTSNHIGMRLSMWVKIFRFMAGDMPKSILEVGPNIGLNIRAMKMLCDAEFFAVEPNAKARKVLIEENVLPKENLQNGFAGDFKLPDTPVDLAFTSGVLIHIHPDDLLKACTNIHKSSGKYIVCYEYFSDKPEMIDYRGHGDKLFKRDFGSFWLENFPDLKCLGYGFEWKAMTGMDNATWWVFEKK